ncbi:MAG TPA: ATP-binding protein [Cytophagaceae bacterium]|jgi:DNA-binding beta-propeller fold protein YncE
MNYSKVWKFFPLIAIVSLSFIIKKSALKSYTLVEQWKTPASLQIPESVVYDGVRNSLYVSNIHGDFQAKDGKGYISKLSLDGRIENLKWITGLNAPKGLGLYKDKLYIADNTTIVVADVKSGKILNKIEVKDALFLNDITVDTEGNVYVSDFQAKKIYKLSGATVTVVYENEKLINPNGLLSLEKELLMVDMGSGILYSIDPKSSKATIVADSLNGADGIEQIAPGEYLVSNFNGEIYYVNRSGDVKLILDTKIDKINAADIEYIADKKLLLIPTFFANTVAAYKLELRK